MPDLHKGDAAFSPKRNSQPAQVEPRAPFQLESHGDRIGGESLMLDLERAFMGLFKPTTLQKGLNADLLDGRHADEFLRINKYRQASASIVLTPADDAYMIDVSGSGSWTTVTLPPAASVEQGYTVVIRKTSIAATVVGTLVGVCVSGTDTLDGSNVLASGSINYEHSLTHQWQAVTVRLVDKAAQKWATVWDYGLPEARETSFARVYNSKSSNFNVNANSEGSGQVYLVDVSGGNVTATLPDYNDVPEGFKATFSIGTAGNTLTISSGDTIYGPTTLTALGSSITVARLAGAPWVVVSYVNTSVGYTDEQAQDAVGGILVDSGTIDFTYSDGTPSITAIVIDDSIANTKLANMAQSTIKGRAAGAGTGDPTDLTATQATAILNTFTSGLQGLVPASGGGTSNFLRADGNFAVPPGTGSGTVTHTGGALTAGQMVVGAGGDDIAVGGIALSGGSLEDMSNVGGIILSGILQNNTNNGNSINLGAATGAGSTAAYIDHKVDTDLALRVYRNAGDTYTQLQGGGGGGAAAPMVTKIGELDKGIDLDTAGTVNVAVAGATALQVTAAAVTVTPQLITQAGHRRKVTRVTGASTISTATDVILADTDGGGFTVDLPASPTSGDTYTIKNVGGSAQILTVGRNGNNINGAASDLSLADGESRELIYETTEGWQTIACC